MVGLILSAILGGPIQPCGQVVCDFTGTGRYCHCAPPILIVGSWDPRPLEWDTSYYKEPPEFGAYPTETAPVEK